MPTFFNKNNNWRSLLETVLDLRLGNNNKRCLVDHQADDSFCCLTNSDIAKEEIIINILQKDTDHLLERWIIHYERSNGSIEELLENMTQFIQSHPITYRMHAMIACKNQLCFTHYAPDGMIEFRKLARLKASRFNSNSTFIQVVLDETTIMQKKPLISFEAPLHPSYHRPLTTTPIIAVRRLSRLSLSAIDQDEDPMDEDEYGEDAYTHTTTSIPIPSSHIMQYTTHRNAIAYSTSPINSRPSVSPSPFLSIPIPAPRRNSLQLDHGCLVGSFEESLFSGRMSSQPSKPITFHCSLGVLGHGDCKPSLKCPSHWSIVFPATFYDLQDDQSTPYVGTVDIQNHVQSNGIKQPGYRIPPKGQIQVVVKNPNKTAVKLFLIPYDFTDMPRNSKTFLRQKSYSEQASNHPDVLRYAIHLHICRTEKKRIYIYRNIRIVFANRIADAREKFKVICEGPKEPVYVPL
ncbi:hypothetical protein G6F43_006709 [Rhizopus delemar]|nr:hypothetical protein G6F43_006709 [Rhizopus delemar]